MRRTTLLLNWVYHKAVGHAVEAFTVAKGFAEGSPPLEIHLLLNAKTPTEIARACPWIARVYPVDLDEVSSNGPLATCFRDIPRDWDYVVTDERISTIPFTLTAKLRSFHNIARVTFHGSRWQGARMQPPLAGAPLYTPNAAVRFSLPPIVNELTEKVSNAPRRICLLLAGSSQEKIYPSIEWWSKVLTMIRRAFPDVRTYITGVTKSHDSRTYTPAHSDKAVSELLAHHPYVLNAYDVDIWTQLALMEKADVFISPHSGFAFLAPCVGTPWLAISGGRWPEYLFNGVPFYCLLPRCEQYPCWAGMKPECARRIQHGTRVLCMDDALEGRLAELKDAIGLLMERKLTFEEAVTSHKKRLAEMEAASDRLYSFDGALGFHQLPSSLLTFIGIEPTSTVGR